MRISGGSILIAIYSGVANDTYIGRQDSTREWPSHKPSILSINISAIKQLPEAGPESKYCRTTIGEDNDLVPQYG